jgi:LytS/YehU family sensor histidine kinase
VVRKNKKKHEQEMKFVKSEYKALNALMNPHFIFNTLNNVQGLFNANDKMAANEYLRIFADLIRQNMHNVSKEIIPLQREIALVMNYLMLEKLRFEDKLNYVINVDDGIDTSEFMVPPLLIQPLVENSIKHGILPMKERVGTVVISISEQANMLCIEVKDNGVGMNHTKKESGIMHESFGIENIKKRIEQLSIIQGKEITFDIREINDKSGIHLWTISTIRMHT